jgi:lipopolysaccharide biosynthesis protein
LNIRPIAIHLPQFHPIPENDAWWGKGFTEWTNVTKAKPLFPGHYQPHLPADLGFYDLRLEEARMEQAALAKEYGIYGFCYYHYWFDGKRLLEKPVNGILESGKPDFPFMICWANENWSRRWDGSESDILMAQNYSRADAIAHSKDLIRHFIDDNYIRINEKPVFAIYKPYLIPNAEEYIGAIREEVYRTRKLELFICGFDTGTPYNQEQLKLFESIIEFQPQSSCLWAFMEKKVQENERGKFKKLYNYLLNKTGNSKKVYEQRNFLKHRLDYGEYVDFLKTHYSYPEQYNVFPGVSPMWDNTARRGKDAFLFYNSTPEKYGEWLDFHVKNYKPQNHGSNFLFINAWNEWAEGNHLEPCRKWGRQYLEVTKNKLKQH